MKRLIIIAALLAGFAVTAAAQSKAVGLRFFGGGVLGTEVTYEQYVNGHPHFVDATIGFPQWSGVALSATYNHVFFEPYWSDMGDWGIYAGAGLSTGVVGSHFMFGLVAQAGIEYSFWFPLQISADIRPTFGVSGSDFYTGGMWGFLPSISLRYKF